MRRPIASGAESLIGTEAEVVSSINPNKHGKYLVRVGGELWSARCAGSLRPGDNVIIAAIDGIKLVVQSHNDGSHSDLSPGEKTGQTGEKGKERGCH